MTKARASLWMFGMTFLTVSFMLLWPYTPKKIVTTATVQMGDLLQTILLAGTASYESERPIVSLLDGQIQRVHIIPGQRVQKGQLLFSLDTTAEEEMLAYVIKARIQQEQLYQEDALAAMAVQGITQLREKEKELRSRIEAAQIRAQQDGRVEQVYVQDGDYAKTAQFLGTLSGEQICICVAADTDTLRFAKIGSPAVIKKNGKLAGMAVLDSLSAPVMEETTGAAAQQGVFRILDAGQINAGDRLTLEMLQNRTETAALVPISAVSRKNEVWIDEGGKAVPVSIDVSIRNDTWVAAGDELTGKKVILLPDLYELTPGCAVQNAEVR